jgi:peptide/nickel transport system ATP-binding protein
MSDLLEVGGLEVSFDTPGGRVAAVRGVSLRVGRGETLGVVGETGSGKSVTTSALMGLLPMPPAHVRAERLTFDGRTLLRGERLDISAVERERGRGMAMIFQDPSSALNPVFPIGDPLKAVLARHAGLRGARANARAVELLDHVGLPDPAHLLGRYPHQLSGGQKQRAAIAMALAARPALLIADEPTTALDATVQAQVLALLKTLQRETGVAMIFISHDLGVVSRVCARVAVMYAGRIVEEAPVERLFAAPAHPYTRGLFAARPTLRRPSMLGEGALVPARERIPLLAIPGSVPPLSRLPAGCAFHPRCRLATGRCAAEAPGLEEVRSGGRVACFHPVEE